MQLTYVPHPAFVMFQSLLPKSSNKIPMDLTKFEVLLSWSCHETQRNTFDLLVEVENKCRSHMKNIVRKTKKAGAKTEGEGTPLENKNTSFKHWKLCPNTESRPDQ